MEAASSWFPVAKTNTSPSKLLGRAAGQEHSLWGCLQPSREDLHWQEGRDSGFYLESIAFGVIKQFWGKKQQLPL